MNCLSQISSHIEAILRSSHCGTRASLYAAYACSWTRTVSYNPQITAFTRNSALTRFGARLYSSKAGKSSESTSQLRLQSKLEQTRDRGEKKEAFYVVRKGDVIGVYRSLNDCLAQAGSSICDHPVSVFKGHRLPKETEEFLTCRGLKDAIYTIRAEDMKEGLFGSLVQCALPVKEEGIGFISASTDPSLSSRSCILKFDGASKGNPGRAGAGAVLLAHDGSLICKLCEGIGQATNNVAEYRAILLGLKHAHKKGFDRISVLGDSKLVCMQVQGLWKARNKNISKLYEEVKKLEEKFLYFQINHVLRKENKEADAQANLAVTLADGEVLEESEP